MSKGTKKSKFRDFLDWCGRIGGAIALLSIPFSIGLFINNKQHQMEIIKLQQQQNLELQRQHDEFEEKDSKKARIIEKRTEHIKTTIEVHDKELISNYNKLADEYNSIVVENSKNKRLISEQRAVLELIERNYQIKYKVSVDSIYTRTKLFNTERIDSALLLLPYYRDKIKKVDDKTWTISVQK